MVRGILGDARSSEIQGPEGQVFQSIMGATEKRRESGAVCRDMGDLSQRGEWGTVYQGCLSGTWRVLKPSQPIIGGNPSACSVGFRRAACVDDLLWIR